MNFIMADSFIGEIRLFPYTSSRIPSNWALCNGAYMFIAQNPTLYAVIKETYGSPGKNTFCLPNLQGRAPMHPGASPFTPGAKGGGNEIPLVVTQLPTHQHEINAIHYNADESDPEGAYLGFDNSKDISPYGEDTRPAKYVSMHPVALQAAGMGNAHENRQPFLALHFCISLQGAFPS
jgi:microcystin-dependent protein